MSKIKDSLFYFIKKTDKVLLFLCLLASSFGILMVYSATRASLREGKFISSDVRTMIIAVLLGVIIAIIISIIDYEVIVKLWPLVAGVGIILMVAVMIIGVAPPARPDSRTWIDLKVFYFQPSELLKICFIITFSVHINRIKHNINNFKNIIFLGLHALIPIGLVMKSGDDGSALVFILIAICMIFVAGIDWKYMVGGIILLIAVIPLLWIKLNSFQKERFIVIIHPELYPKTAYQQNMGLSAIGSGGFLGQGLFKGLYTQSGSVPESKNDMIFSVVGEELGILGAILALTLIFLVIFRVLQTGRRSLNYTANLICYGIGSMVAVQTLINLAMCLRVGPVIGITLPFFSAGGSSSLCLYFSIGVALSIYRSTRNNKHSDFRLQNLNSPFV